MKHVAQSDEVSQRRALRCTMALTLQGRTLVEQAVLDVVDRR
jgi:hypothetical protein